MCQLITNNQMYDGHSDIVGQTIQTGNSNLTHMIRPLSLSIHTHTHTNIVKVLIFWSDIFVRGNCKNDMLQIYQWEIYQFWVSVSGQSIDKDEDSMWFHSHHYYLISPFPKIPPLPLSHALVGTKESSLEMPRNTLSTLFYEDLPLYRMIENKMRHNLEW